MGAYNSALARSMVLLSTLRSADPRRNRVRAQLAVLAERHRQQSEQLVAEYGVLPMRGSRPDLHVTSSREIALRYLADRAQQRQFQADRADERRALRAGRCAEDPPSPGLERHWSRQAAWFVAGAQRGLLIGQLLRHVGGAYAVDSNIVSINADCKDYYRRAYLVGYALAGSAEAQLRVAEIHELAHANFAEAAPSLARVPALERTAALQTVVEGYATWVGDRIVARADPKSGRLVDPALHEAQWARFSREPSSPLQSPYRQGAAWFEQIHRLHGDGGIQAVVKLRADELPRAKEWKDVAGWAERVFKTYGDDAATGPIVSRRGLSNRQPKLGRHRSS